MVNAFGRPREGAFDRKKFLAFCRNQFPDRSLKFVREGLLAALERMRVPTIKLDLPEYDGTYAQYQQERARLLGPTGEHIRPKWLTPKGFAQYASTYHPGKT